ncbi:PC4-domain-containing protein [Rozella allomycis CSF55]|uniref:PC4-domain-containing protein n=1 Tax=Rozella allomycis (strain CSF55) TaxID=988480 RepID=A0A075AP96_ROZAC|nr:ssDNA-binding transcriptional regulator domain-containing protein [Rozella allomycis CSF55]RKP19359.1 PC4-domain-containing protein [Rozella allomycis CSF55]|eukprot:EPZ31879.1 ssDNA-binding transcriptional regulator domain-containing protein [Rozella allomycis CSF55]
MPLSKKRKADAAENKEKFIELGLNKRVSVSEWRGKLLVNLREFYENKSTGELLPGKKGITLNAEQWKILRENMDEIDEWMGMKKEKETEGEESEIKEAEGNEREEDEEAKDGEEEENDE